MRGGVQTFLAMVNLPIAAFNLVGAIAAHGLVSFLLHIFGFAFSATMGLLIWNDR